MYTTKCPGCGGMDGLSVIGGEFSAKMPLDQEGFSFVDAKNFETFNEKVQCNICEHVFGLEELTM